MKSNYQITIEYEGTNYKGWQYQKNGSSIQNEIEKVLKKLLKKKIRVIGSGRTDAGVHAVSQSANFFCDKIDNDQNFLNSLNFFLSKAVENNLKLNAERQKVESAKQNKKISRRTDLDHCRGHAGESGSIRTSTSFNGI